MYFRTEWLGADVGQVTLGADVDQGTVVVTDPFLQECESGCNMFHAASGVVAVAQHARRLVIAHHEHWLLVFDP